MAVHRHHAGGRGRQGRLVDSYAPKGHDACAAPARRWVEGEVPASSAFMFHPNAAGMEAQATMLVKRLRSQS